MKGDNRNDLDHQERKKKASKMLMLIKGSTHQEVVNVNECVSMHRKHKLRDLKEK